MLAITNYLNVLFYNRNIILISLLIMIILLNLHYQINSLFLVLSHSIIYVPKVVIGQDKRIHLLMELYALNKTRYHPIDPCPFRIFQEHSDDLITMYVIGNAFIHTTSSSKEKRPFDVTRNHRLVNLGTNNAN